MDRLTSGLVPRPVEWEPQDGAFTVPAGVAIQAPADWHPVATQLAVLLTTATGTPCPVGTGDAVIRLTLSPTADYPSSNPETAAEAYLLDIDENGIAITARAAAGAFRAVQTLLKLLPPGAEQGLLQHVPLVIPAVHIADVPRFAYRGVMLDVARSFLTVDEVKKFLDAVVPFGVSHLHLHLADDQGWRIEIHGTDADPADPIDYSALTRISSKTAVTEHADQTEPGHVGHYTQDDLAEIVRYARERFVVVVPEIDVPGHTNAALTAIPQLNTQRSLPPLPSDQQTVQPNGSAEVGYSALDEQLPLSYLFVRQVFRELAAITGTPLVHLGGDESHAMGHSRYTDFVRRVLPQLRAALPAGVGTMGWTEYAEAGLDQGENYWDGCVVQYWFGETEWVRDFTDKGGRVVLSPGRHAYLDMKYDPSTPIGLTWAGDHNEVDAFYGWEPTAIPAGEEDGIDESVVLGVEACLWSETVRGIDQALFLTFPRVAAVLEVGWSCPDRDFDDFARRLGGLAPWLVLQDITFHPSPLVSWRSVLVGGAATIGPRAVVGRLVGTAADCPAGRLTTPVRTLNLEVLAIRESHSLSGGTEFALVAHGLTEADAGECTLELGDGQRATVRLSHQPGR